MYLLRSLPYIVFLQTGAREKYDGCLTTLEVTPTIAATHLQSCVLRKDWVAAEAVFFQKARLCECFPVHIHKTPYIPDFSSYILSQCGSEKVRE
ncbi:hypothetical protein DIPPA_01570 [Diplonema papillatum]|nr:hypothetical protein DIPPA_01570 [Diplonema papillatum]